MRCRWKWIGVSAMVLVVPCLAAQSAPMNHSIVEAMAVWLSVRESMTGMRPEVLTCESVVSGAPADSALLATLSSSTTSIVWNSPCDDRSWLGRGVRGVPRLMVDSVWTTKDTVVIGAAGYQWGFYNFRERFTKAHYPPPGITEWRVFGLHIDD